MFATKISDFWLPPFWRSEIPLEELVPQGVLPAIGEHSVVPALADIFDTIIGAKCCLSSEV